MNKDILRLMDANMNRAVEGIRVLEETSRMILDDRELTTSIKDIRHKLVQIISEKTDLTLGMVEARDSEHDVLRDGETLSEQTRNDLFSIVKANASRSQEAVRAMEEFAKLSFPGLSERFKHIRFRLYDVEKSLILQINVQKLN